VSRPSTTSCRSSASTSAGVGPRVEVEPSPEPIAENRTDARPRPTPRPTPIADARMLLLRFIATSRTARSKRGMKPGAGYRSSFRGFKDKSGYPAALVGHDEAGIYIGEGRGEEGGVGACSVKCYGARACPVRNQGGDMD
jgi:hypothetical protein